MAEHALAGDRRVFGLGAQPQGQLQLTAADEVLSRLLEPYLAVCKPNYPAIDLQLLSTAGMVE